MKTKHSQQWRIKWKLNRLEVKFGQWAEVLF